MSAQLTLQAPLELPPTEVAPYLDKLWEVGLEGSSGATTFTLIIWEPSWLEQQMVRIGRFDGPISGLLSQELLAAARETVPEFDLPHSTAPMDPRLAWRLGKLPGSNDSQDLRGRVVDSAFSILMPRRLITLAPTINGALPLETMVAAYCPLPEDGGV